MKKTLLTLALAIFALGGTSVAFAQDNQKDCKAETVKCDKDKKCNKDRKGKPTRKGVDRQSCGENKNCGSKGMFKGIELTPEQKAKIEKIQENSKAELAKIKTDSREDRDKVMAKSREEVEKVLTAEQKVQFQANVKSMEERRAAKQDGRRIKKEYKKVKMRGEEIADTIGSKTVKVYNKAKDGVVKGYNAVKEEVTK